MHLFKTLFMICLVALIPASANSEKSLTAAEIRSLLTGNTAIGRWIDHRYRQYFNADGSTIYAQSGQRSALGRWRVNSQTNQYESWWERAGWGSGYRITKKDGVYYWVSSTGNTPPQAFELLVGQQLVDKRQ